MTKRQPAAPAPGPLEAYCQQFDALFRQRPQRASLRRYLEGLLLPQERTKTLTALANTEPVVGAQHPHAQALQWFLSESTWDPAVVNEQRVALLCADLQTAPTAQGVLVIDEQGERTWGSKTAHVGRQYLANLGKTDNGVVSVTSLWADETVYSPLHYEPYTQAHHFPRGKADPQFRTKRQSAAELVGRAVAAGGPCRAVVADCFYGEDESLRAALRARTLGYVLALPPAGAGGIPRGRSARSRRRWRQRPGAGRTSRVTGCRSSGTSATATARRGGCWRSRSVPMGRRRRSAWSWPRLIRAPCPR